jgi:hypothetical protein
MKKIIHALILAGMYSVAAPAGHATAVVLQQATATFSQTTGSRFIDRAINGDLTDGWAISPNITSQTAVFETSANLGSAAGTLFTFVLTQAFASPQHTLGHFRLSLTTDDRSLFADGLASGGDVTANWTVLDPMTFVSANGATLTELGDYSILASGFSPDNDVYTVTASTTLTDITGIRLEALTDASLPFGGPGRKPTNGNFVLSEFQVYVPDAPAAAPSNTAAAVPEPSTWLMFLTGASLLWFTARRRNFAVRARRAISG